MEIDCDFRSEIELFSSSWFFKYGKSKGLCLLRGYLKSEACDQQFISNEEQFSQFSDVGV